MDDVLLRRWLGRAASAAAASIVAVLGLAVVVRLFTRRRIVGMDELPPLPVALVLGAEVYADGRPSAFLRARLDLASELLRRGLAARLLLSGDGRSRFYDETGGMRRYLVDAGIDPGLIEVDPAGLDTYDSCLRARDVFGVRRMVVVSQRYHLPRALAICRAIGVDAWGVGDESLRRSARNWAYGARREVAANLKLVWDLASRRPPRGT